MTAWRTDETEIPMEERQAAALRIQALAQQRNADRHASERRRRAEIDRALTNALSHTGFSPLAVIEGSDSRHTRDGEPVYWTEAVIHLDPDHHPDPSWHPGDPGCYRLVLRATSRTFSHVTALGWHWDGAQHIRYESEIISPSSATDAIAASTPGTASDLGHRCP